jgi:hypothetical protein
MIPKIGIVFRSYAKTPELVSEVVERAITSVKKALDVKVRNVPIFKSIIIAIPTDYDCGNTATALFNRIKAEKFSEIIEIFPIDGHHSSEVLNEVMFYLYEKEIEYGLIVSNKAVSYLTNETMAQVCDAINQGAAVAGVRIKELDDVQEVPIQNTFAAWNLFTLLNFTNGFESKSEVEEISPIFHILCWGGFAVVISAKGSLDVRKSEDGKDRHQEVRDTKRALQEQEAARLGVTLDFVKANIIEL